jgi:spore maturation protein CgeB
VTNILFIYKYDHAYNIDFWLHENFMHACNQVKRVNAFVYGPRMHENPSNKCPLHFSRTHTMQTLQDVFKPDLIICNTKSRMFAYYDPHGEIVKADNCILPKDFKDSKIPKIMLEEDYHYEKDDDWYSEMGFSLILQRHKSQSIREQKVKMRWLPFSVDTTSFTPFTDKDRINKVAFAGSMSRAYLDRIDACNQLTAHSLIDVYGAREKSGDNYVKCLKEYTVHLNGASNYDITAAKVFEITASGSVLFTNQFSGLEELFSKDSYVLWNKDNIIEKANELLNDKDKIISISENGYKETLKKHNHSIRTQEMIKIIEENI